MPEARSACVRGRWSWQVVVLDSARFHAHEKTLHLQELSAQLPCAGRCASLLSARAGEAIWPTQIAPRGLLFSKSAFPRLLPIGRLTSRALAFALRPRGAAVRASARWPLRDGPTQVPLDVTAKAASRGGSGRGPQLRVATTAWLGLQQKNVSRLHQGTGQAGQLRQLSPHWPGRPAEAVEPTLPAEARPSVRL